jgi:hypothetical protein
VSEPNSAPAPYGAVPPNQQLPPAYPAAPYGAWVPARLALGPVGQVRGTGICILLTLVTLGIYPLVWFFKTHSEMKRHSGQGIDGGIALLLAIFVHIVMPYITSSEVGALYEATGRPKPVSAATGLWYFPGSFIIVGPLIWFIQTNGALNAYWRSLGAA